MPCPKCGSSETARDDNFSPVVMSENVIRKHVCRCCYHRFMSIQMALAVDTYEGRQVLRIMERELDL